MNARNGFTLVEVLTVTALLSAALAMIWQVWLSAEQTGQVLDRKMTATTATAHGMDIIRRELRSASRSALSILPAEEIQYRILLDRDGNGVPFDADGLPEWSDVRTITRDRDDANGDGLHDSQLILVQESGVTVLASGLRPPKSENPADGGIYFEADGQGVRVYLAVEGTTRRKLTLTGRAVETVHPRNE